MLHPTVETCLVQRKVVVRELDEEDPCTYAGLCRYSCIYGDLKDISRDGLWLKIV